MKGDALVALGVIARPHGVRGEVRVHRYNERSTLLAELDAVWLRDAASKKARKVDIEHARWGPKDVLLLTLAGLDDRDAAEAMRGVELCVPREALPDTDEDEWYHVDLIGLTVRDATGAVLGEVADVITYPTIDCLAVRSDEGTREVPIAEPWLVSVDLDAREVRVGDVDDIPIQPEREREKKR